MYRDRTDAGRKLAEYLLERDVDVDVVLAIPRGGLPIGRPVADALGVPLDVVVAKKLGAPGNPELAIGAVGSDGSVWRNDDLVARLGVSEEYLERERERKAREAREKLRTYRGDREPLELADRRVLVADDGVATGATTIACLRYLRAADVAYVALAVPVGPPDTVTRLSSDADDVFCLETPSYFSAVGQFYDSFAQVSDGEAVTYLDDGS